MSPERYLRKSRPAVFLTDDAPHLVLLRDLFIQQGAPFCVKELAADLDVDPYTIYKMFSAQTRLPAEVLFGILEHIGTRDHRLIDFICARAGYVPMPADVLENRTAIRDLLEHAGRVVKED